MSFEFEDYDQSEYHSGMPIIFRLDAICKKIDNASLHQDYHTHYQTLLVFYKELSYALKEDEIKEQWEYMENARKVINELNKQDITSDYVKISYSKLDILHQWEIELRLLQQKYNLAILKKEDPRWAMAKR